MIGLDGDGPALARRQELPAAQENREDFLDAIKEAFQRIDWDKAYKEFRAAGEKEK